MTDLDQYIQGKHAIHSHTKLRLALPCLYGPFEPLITLGLQWQEFEPKILSLYDSRSARTQVKCSIFAAYKNRPNPSSISFASNR